MRDDSFEQELQELAVGQWNLHGLKRYRDSVATLADVMKRLREDAVSLLGESGIALEANVSAIEENLRQIGYETDLLQRQIDVANTVRSSVGERLDGLPNGDVPDFFVDAVRFAEVGISVTLPGTGLVVAAGTEGALQTVRTALAGYRAKEAEKLFWVVKNELDAVSNGGGYPNDDDDNDDDDDGTDDDDDNDDDNDDDGTDDDDEEQKPGSGEIGVSIKQKPIPGVYPWGDSAENQAGLDSGSSTGGWPSTSSAGDWQRLSDEERQRLYGMSVDSSMEGSSSLGGWGADGGLGGTSGFDNGSGRGTGSAGGAGGLHGAGGMGGLVGIGGANGGTGGGSGAGGVGRAGGAGMRGGLGGLHGGSGGSGGLRGGTSTGGTGGMLAGSIGAAGAAGAAARGGAAASGRGGIQGMMGGAGGAGGGSKEKKKRGLGLYANMVPEIEEDEEPKPLPPSAGPGSR